jgi:tRNA-dihydrouridine synthase 1
MSDAAPLVHCQLCGKHVKRSGRLCKACKADNPDEPEALTAKRRKHGRDDGVAGAGDVSVLRTLVPAASLPAHQLVLAPMVGGSELPFRLLARRYGAQLCYTPMLYSGRFVESEEYRAEQLRRDSDGADTPLVAHFCGNDPDVLVAAGRLAAQRKGVVAVDLNLGCPQRVAHAGHFGSYLCATEAGRAIALRCVAAMAKQVPVPVFVKIRLLDEGLSETLAFCSQLRDAGAALLAVHARYRGSPTRRRDGPADLEAVRAIKQALPDMPILSNGNIRDAKDLLAALKATGADGIMSAEGALDDPALFARAAALNAQRRKKLRKELKAAPEDAKLQKKLARMPRLPALQLASGDGELPDRPALALEYLQLARQHSDGGPAAVASARFHVRRMCREQLTERVLLSPLLEAATQLGQVEALVRACVCDDPGADAAALAELTRAAACEKRNAEKRKEFAGRMQRKAKREGHPEDFYLRTGSVPPTASDVATLRRMDADKRMAWWAAEFGQHCLALHAEGVCARAISDFGCAYLHVPATPDGAAEPLGTPSWLAENAASAAKPKS